MGLSSVDELLKKYGGDPGRYQVLVFVLLLFSMCSLAFNNMINLFMIGIYPHHCKIPEGTTKNESIPRESSTNEFESCLIFANSSDHELGTVDCDNGWNYYPPDGEWSIVQEWDLVCDKHYQGALATTIYFAGVTIGSAVFGYLADMMGRKPIFIFGVFAHVIASTVTAFSNSYLMFVIFRFLHGFGIQGSFGCAYTLCVELFQPRWRTMVAITAQAVWPLMLLVLTIVFYFVKNWQTVFLLVNVPFVVTISYIWLIPESIRWLLAVGKLTGAKDVIKRTAHFNKIRVPATVGDEISVVAGGIAKEKQRGRQRRYGFLDLIRLKKMRIISCVSFYYYFVAIFAFYAIAFAMTGLKVNIYLNFFVTSLIEFAVVVLMYPVLLRVGRKTMTWLSLFISSFICFLVVILLLVLPEDGASQMGVAILAAFGRSILAGYFCAMPISELSPTVVRNLLNGIANFWGRIGSMVAPQVMLLELYVWKPLPFLLCALLMFVGGLLTFLLPETKDRPLIDVPEDVDVLWEPESAKRVKLIPVTDIKEKYAFSPLTKDAPNEDYY